MKKYNVKVSFELETEIESNSLDEAGNKAVEEFWEQKNADLLNIQYYNESGDELVDGEDE